MYIYIVKNILNNHWYIGKRSISSNSSDFNRYYGSGTRIKKAIKEYGKENFIKEILEECVDKNQLAERELFWIKKHIDELGAENCYNILLDCNYVGRSSGFKQTKEHILKRVCANRKSGAYKWDKKRRDNLSKFMKNRIIWNKGLKGHTMLSESKKCGKNPNARMVIDNITGKIFETVKDASVYYMINKNTLQQYLSGARKNKTTMKYL